MTPDELATQCRQQYNAVNDPHFSDDFIYNLIYMAQMEIANLCYIIEKVYTVTGGSVANQREYSYPTLCIAIRRLEYDGLKLEKVDIDQEPDSSTTEQTGTPGSYAIYGNRIYLFPTPDTDAKEIKIFTYNMPDSVSSTSVLDIPSQYHTAIIDFIIAGMYAKDKDRQMATYHRNIWENSKLRICQDNRKRKRGDKFTVVKNTYLMGY